MRARSCWQAGGTASGAPYTPPFPSLRAAPQRRARVFHSSDNIDFARFKGGRVGVLGASASAFDNAAVALETGAAEVRLFSRRPHLPQINKSKWTVFAGFFHGYRRSRRCAALADLHLHLGEAMPPPHESVLRCDRHPGFTLHFAEAWLDVIPATDGVTVVTAKARYAFDAVIMATGFSVDLARRPRARAHLRQGRCCGAIASRRGGGAPPAGGALSLSRPRLRADRAHAGHGAGPRQHPLLQCRLPPSAMAHWRATFPVSPRASTGCRAPSPAACSWPAPDVLQAALAAHDDRELEPTRYFLPR